MIGDGYVVDVGDLHTTLWVPVSAAKTAAADRDNYQVLDFNLDDWVVADVTDPTVDTTGKAGTSIKWTPSVDVQLVALQLITGGASLSPGSPTVSWKLSSAAQGDITSSFVTLAASAGPTTIHTPFTGIVKTILAGDTVTFRLTATTVVSGDMYFRGHLLYTAAWGK
jgi:hypothetical protein